MLIKYLQIYKAFVSFLGESYIAQHSSNCKRTNNLGTVLDNQLLPLSSTNWFNTTEAWWSSEIYV